MGFRPGELASARSAWDALPGLLHLADPRASLQGLAPHSFVLQHSLGLPVEHCPNGTTLQSVTLCKLEAQQKYNMTSHDGALVGLGNPLLDISAVVDQAFLDKYDVRDALMSQIATCDDLSKGI
jgi:hypothetical protein